MKLDPRKMEPSSLWKIYYEHWAKDANAERRKKASKKNIRQTIHLIWSWMEAMPRDTPITKFNQKQTDLLDSLISASGYFYTADLEEKFTTIRQIADYLFPYFLEREWFFRFEVFVMNVSLKLLNGTLERTNITGLDFQTPIEKRVIRNIGGRYKKDAIFSMKADQLRSVDAIVALL